MPKNEGLPTEADDLVRTTLLEFLREELLPQFLADKVMADLETDVPKKRRMEELARWLQKYEGLAKKQAEIEAASTLSAQGYYDERVWAQRSTFVLSFLPFLPLKASTFELRTILGGVEPVLSIVDDRFVPPGDRAIAAKTDEYRRLPLCEQECIASLCRSLATRFEARIHAHAEEAFAASTTGSADGA